MVWIKTNIFRIFGRYLHLEIHLKHEKLRPILGHEKLIPQINSKDIFRPALQAFFVINYRTASYPAYMHARNFFQSWLADETNASRD